MVYLTIISHTDIVFSPSDRSLSAGWVGLVGRRGPRSKQPFMVTFFRASQAPCRPPRAVKPNPHKKKPKYDLPLPSIHGEVLQGQGTTLVFILLLKLFYAQFKGIVHLNYKITSIAFTLHLKSKVYISLCWFITYFSVPFRSQPCQQWTSGL